MGSSTALQMWAIHYTLCKNFNTLTFIFISFNYKLLSISNWMHYKRMLMVQSDTRNLHYLDWLSWLIDLLCNQSHTILNMNYQPLMITLNYAPLLVPNCNVFLSSVNEALILQWSESHASFPPLWWWNCSVCPQRFHCSYIEQRF